MTIGSTDSCGKICDYYALIDSRIKVIHKENGGQGSARNVGLNIFKGEYVLFLDSDDYLELNCVQLLVEDIEKKKVDISICNYNFVNENGKIEKKFSDSDDLIIDGYDILRNMWNDRIINIAPWAKLFKRELWETFRFKECYCEDSASMYLLYKKTIKASYNKKTLMNYVIRFNSDVRSFSEKKLIMLDIYDEIIDYSLKNLPVELQKAAKSKTIAVNFHVLSQIPKGTHINEKKRIYSTIKKYRQCVLFDTNARMKNRIACCISYLGPNLTTFVLYLIKKVKYTF